jgi:hypothetical protein
MKTRLTLLAFALAAVAVAQDKAPAQPAAAPPQPPKMSAEGKKFLEGWLGSWTSNDTVYAMGPQKMKGSLKMSCESVSSGWGTLCKGTLNAEGMPPSQATFLMAWDLATGMGHMFEVGDTGEVHERQEHLARAHRQGARRQAREGRLHRHLGLRERAQVRLCRQPGRRDRLDVHLDQQEVLTP